MNEKKILDRSSASELSRDSHDSLHLGWFYFDMSLVPECARLSPILSAGPIVAQAGVDDVVSCLLDVAANSVATTVAVTFIRRGCMRRRSIFTTPALITPALIFGSILVRCAA